ncbi:MAG: hypothetical protein HYS05_18345 [Acidobacteria bacterium]|nr:hypothetical protein [Acidobacteriota bacterium]
MRRREFLIQAAAVAGIASTRRVWAQGGTPAKVKQSTLDRIAIMTLNFQSMLRLPDLPEGPQRTLELFDVPQMLADHYGVHKVEFQHYHIPSTEPSYLKELRSRIEKHKSRMTQINLEFGQLNMSAPELRNRLMAIDLTKMWVDHAVMLGAQRVMINQGQPTHENKAYGIPTLKAMADYGKSKGIIVSVETRGGGGGRGRGAAGAAPGAAAGAARGAAPTAPPPAAAALGAAPAAAPPSPPELTGPARWMLLAEIIKDAGAYSNVDVGGAGAANQQELHACLKTLFPMTAGSMHTRVNVNWDLATAIKFLEGELGYKGLYTIEAGNGHEGTQPIYDVVVATL